MNNKFDRRVVVVAGGTSTEREVSSGSGKACAVALARRWPTRLVNVTSLQLPESIDPSCDVVFSTLHGTFGEDGAMQRLLDAAQIHYAGSDAVSSELTFAKDRTKQLVADQLEGRVPAGITFAAEEIPSAESLIVRLGENVVIKPDRGGSSLGLSLCSGRDEISQALAGISEGFWLAEERILGREVTVGILGNTALPVVEIAPRSGVFDYAAKYTKGLTEYLAPAPIDPQLAYALQKDALLAYMLCGCRDFARIDFMITEKNEWFLLEINTLPGMKETSLLPMGAKSMGIDFTELVSEMISPAMARHAQAVEGGVNV